MNVRFAIWILMAALFGCNQVEEQSEPVRPINVPQEAMWAGGPDGGHWLKCQEITREQDRYNCIAYDDHEGSVVAEGEFVLRSYVWDTQKNRVQYSLPNTLALPKFSFFDGQAIHLSDNKVLLPDGDIHYPFEGGHGKIQKYLVGEPVGPEIEY